MYTMKWACKKVGRPLLSLLAVAAASLLIYWWHILSPYMHLPAVTDDQLDALDLSGYTKILFSAHPDDELIWGGGHLLDDKYLVVCMTGGNNPVRSKEFQSVVTEAGGKYLMLSYPDKLGNKRSSWKYWRAAMEKDVATILNYKDWQLVATHNENGEYGHLHHQMTHQIIEKEYKETGCKAELYWFGTYYVNDRIPYSLREMDKELYIRKRKLAMIYESQRSTIRKMYHMFPYEYWKNAATGELFSPK